MLLERVVQELVPEIAPQSKALFMFRIFIHTLSSLALLSCSGMPDQNQDPAKNNRTSYRKDMQECKEVYPESASGAYLKQWDGCMRLKGWK